MAITTQAQAGVVATSAAKNGSVSSGTTTTVTLDSSIATNNGNLTAGATLAGRLIYIDTGPAAGQIRYIVSDNGSTVATVSEAWDTTPSSSDTYQICYILDDMATVTGLTFQSKSNSYTSGRRAVVGNGTDFAFVGILDGAFLESTDNSSTTVGDFTIENNALFQSGYEAAGAALSGGYYIAAPAVDGELAYDAKSGSTVNLYDYQCRSVNSSSWEHDGGTHVWQRCKIFKSTYQMLLLGTVSITDSTIEGTSLSTDTITIDTTFTTDRLKVINMNGFIGNSTGTYELRDVDWISPLLIINAATGTTWNVINPTGWSIINIANQNNLAITGTGTVNWRLSLDTTVVDTSGAAISTPRVFLYEGTQTDSLVLDLTGNASGVVGSSWIYRNYVDNGGTALTLTEYGNHALRVDRWTYFPFVASQNSSTKIEGTTTLGIDTQITNTNQTTALSTGTTAGVTWNEDTNSSSVIEFSGGTGTLSVGDTVTGGTSSATGIVTQILSGDSTAGEIHLRTRNVNVFSGTESLSNGAGWSATLVSGSEQRFAIWIDAKSISMAQLYDYLAAESSASTLGTIGTNIHLWGKSTRARALVSTGSSYYTNRHIADTKGIIVINAGAGTIDFYTSDDGTTWIPPVSYNFALTGLKDGSEVRLHLVSNGNSIAGVEDMTGGTGTSATNGVSVSGSTNNNTFTYSYVYSSDTTVYAVIMNFNYQYIRQTFTLSNNSQTIPITQIIDRNYNDPV